MLSLIFTANSYLIVENFKMLKNIEIFSITISKLIENDCELSLSQTASSLQKSTDVVARRCSVRKGVVRNFAKFTGKHMCQSLFFSKVAGGNRMVKHTQTIRRQFAINNYSCFQEHFKPTSHK